MKLRSAFRMSAVKQSAGPKRTIKHSTLAPQFTHYMHRRINIIALKFMCVLRKAATGRVSNSFFMIRNKTRQKEKQLTSTPTTPFTDSANQHQTKTCKWRCTSLPANDGAYHSLQMTPEFFTIRWGNQSRRVNRYTNISGMLFLL